MKKKLLFMLTLVLAALPAFSDTKIVDIATLFGNAKSIAKFGTTTTKKESGEFIFSFTKTGASTSVYQYNGRTYNPAGIQMAPGNTMLISGK